MRLVVSESWYLQGWEFALWFFEQVASFLCERKSEIVISFIFFERIALSLFCKEWHERIAHGSSLKKSKWAKSNRSASLLGIKRGKTVKNIQKIQIFQANRSFFESDLIISLSNSIMSLFSKEQQERFAHDRSLQKSDVNKSLTGAH